MPMLGSPCAGVNFYLELDKPKICKKSIFRLQNKRLK